jgi:predicted O-methyltransferase YrrM
MGVENIGPLLYSLVRFTKVRKVVEIGAGYTSVWILQALNDNDDEMRDVAQLQHDGKAMLLNWPWTVTPVVEQYCDDNFKKSSLLCVDNCLHQKETATGAAAVAKTLNLDSYFEFIQGDAFNMEFEPASVDMLWCDFGVGSRMADFCPSAWSSIRPGGFLVCHSTLTNLRTRTWLDAVRARAPESETGLPPDEFVELSLLEPHKHYQNSVTILQRRLGPSKDDDGKEPYVEPVFSEYA